MLIKLDDGVVFEVPGDPNVGNAAGAGEVQSVSGRVDDALSVLKTLVDKFSAGWDDLAELVKIEKATITVKMGVTAKGNFFVAQGEASANMEVAVTFIPGA